MISFLFRPLSSISPVHNRTRYPNIFSNIHIMMYRYLISDAFLAIHLLLTHPIGMGGEAITQRH